ncbi:hypothetical protein AB6A40_009081 [Gnathostoma spinigerum]|uniref:Transcription initiation factor TFIID subunit 12 n=1 Tax=Gnathostoma spinigerum TaxID=75299 RepID=A0ABD6F045_9BILA
MSIGCLIVTIFCSLLTDHICVVEKFSVRAYEVLVFKNYMSSQQNQMMSMQQQQQQSQQSLMLQQSSQSMQMPPCSNISSYQLAGQMGTPHVIPQTVTVMGQSGHPHQQGNPTSQLMQQVSHQIVSQQQAVHQQQQGQPTQQAQMIRHPIGQQQIMSGISPSNQQSQPHQPAPQMLQHQNINQPSMSHSPGFAQPSPSHMRVPSVGGYQQLSPHRPPVNCFPSSPAELSTQHTTQQHSTSFYRPSVQRTPVPNRSMGQSSAIRQALGHLPSTPTTSSSSSNHHVQCEHPVSVPTPTNCSAKLLERDALEALIKSVDPLETVEDDVTEALLQFVEEFVDDIVDHTARVAKHRSSNKLEPKDVQYVLERRYKIFLPTTQSNGAQSLNDRTPYSKYPATEAHRQRMNLIKKVIQKP